MVIAGTLGEWKKPLHRDYEGISSASASLQKCERLYMKPNRIEVPSTARQRDLPNHQDP